MIREHLQEAACLFVCFLDDQIWRFGQMPGTSVKILSDVIRICHLVLQVFDTPWKVNIAPEKWWLEDYFPIGKVTFQGVC